MRLHPVTWLMIMGAMLKLGVLAVSMAGLIASVVYIEADSLAPIDTAFLLGVITQPMSWNLRDLAQAAALVGVAFWVEALVRINRRLVELNSQAMGKIAHV